MYSIPKPQFTRTPFLGLRFDLLPEEDLPPMSPHGRAASFADVMGSSTPVGTVSKRNSRSFSRSVCPESGEPMSPLLKAKSFRGISPGDQPDRWDALPQDHRRYMMEVQYQEGLTERIEEREANRGVSAAHITRQEQAQGWGLFAAIWLMVVKSVNRPLWELPFIHKRAQMLQRVMFPVFLR